MTVKIPTTHNCPVQSPTWTKEAGFKATSFWKPIPPGRIIGELHFHVPVDRPSSGGPFEINDPFEVLAGTDWLQVWVHQCEFMFYTRPSDPNAPYKPLDIPFSGIDLHAIAYKSNNVWRFQLRFQPLTKEDEVLWTGWVGISGIATSSQAN